MPREWGARTGHWAVLVWDLTLVVIGGVLVSMAVVAVVVGVEVN